jgi:signal transduction histidine kinase
VSAVPVLLLLALLLPPGALAQPGRVATLDSASLLLDARDTPPPDDAPGWVPVTLPDEWRRERPERDGFAWYRIELAGPAAPGEHLALLLSSVGMNAAAWVNGEPVGTGGRFEEPVARNFNRPLYFPFPSSLLARERNVIHVRLWCYATPHHGYLGPLRVGPDALLRPEFEHRLLVQSRLTELSTWLAALMVLFVSALWVGSRFDGIYGWFALATGFWAITSLNWWVRDVPVHTWTWERLVAGPIEGFAVAFAIWVHRFLGLVRPRLERVLLGFAIVSFVAIALLPRSALFPLVVWLHATALAISTYAVVELARGLPRTPRWQPVLYLTAGVLGLSFGVHGLALQLGAIPATAPQLLPFVVPVMLSAFGTTLTARFVSSLRAAESLSHELERRVAEEHAALEQSYARMRELEREQVLAQERERLMREMHDGLGGHLVSALSLAEQSGTPREALTAALRNALDDMRAVIDSLDPQVEDLGQLLGQLRARLEPMLRCHGLGLAWDVGRGHALPRLGPEQSLHVLRILQESITNVVKHAAAREVRISTRGAANEAPGVTLVVEDDGRGVDGSAAGGRGIANMQARARAIGASLQVRAAAPGTRVELELPATAPRS